MPAGADPLISLWAFVTLVLRDEETGEPITVQPYHVELMEALVNHRRLVVTAHVESGKTNIAVAWCAWMLGQNPRLRIAVLSESSSLAIDIVSQCARYIDDESFDGCLAVRAIFPDLRRSRAPGDSWAPSDGRITVARGGGVKDPSMSAFGADKGITGRRVDVALLDDYVTPKTTETPYLRKQQANAFFRRVYGRVTSAGRIVFFNNAQWDDDCAAQFANKPGVHEHLMPVTITGTVDGDSEWEDRWPAWRIKETVEQNPDSPAQLFCIRRKAGKTGRFPVAAIEAAKAAGRGLGWPFIPEAPPVSAVVCIGVDFAFTQKKHSDKSALVAVLREKPREHRKIGRRTVMDVRAGKWTEDQALSEFSAFVRQFTSRGYRVRIRAESNAGQHWIAQRWASVTGAAIEPYVTGAKKWDPVTGVPGLAASFALGQYVLPTDNFGTPSFELSELISDLLAFDPDPRSHTPDRVMGLFFAEGLAMDVANTEMRAYTITDTVEPDDGDAYDDPEEAALLKVIEESGKPQTLTQMEAEALAALEAARQRDKEAEAEAKRREAEMIAIINGTAPSTHGEEMWSDLRSRFGV